MNPTLTKVAAGTLLATIPACAVPHVAPGECVLERVACMSRVAKEQPDLGPHLDLTVVSTTAGWIGGYDDSGFPVGRYQPFDPRPALRMAQLLYYSGQ